MAYNPNALQLTHVLQQLYRRLGGVMTLATDGSESVVVDTKLAEQLGEGNVDDFLNGGTLIVVETSDHAAPEGQFARIEDYDSLTTTLTLSPALTAPVQSGDRVMFIGADFPLYDMIEVVNDALKYLGEIPVPDETLLTALAQTEYLLPAAATGRQLLDIEIQTLIGDADNRGFVPIENWGIAAAGANGQTTLILPQFGAGYTLRVTYLGNHGRVDQYDDTINGYLHSDLVHSVVFAHAIQWKNDQNAIQGAPDQALLGLEQKAWSQVDRARVLHPIMIPPRRIQGLPHFTAGGGRLYHINPPYSTYG